MPNQQTITDLKALQTGVNATTVSFKARRAVAAAHQQTCGGVTTLSSTPYYQGVLTTAINNTNAA